MRRLATMAVMLVLAVPATCGAQFASEPGTPESAWKVKLTFTDGEAMEGVIWLYDVSVKAEHGTYAVEPAKVQELRFEAVKEKQNDDAAETPTPSDTTMNQYVRTGKLIARSGKEIEGQIWLQSQRQVRISTDLGFLHPDLRKVKSITFLEKAPD